MTKTLTLLASGTRGDVQPYLALGLGLRQAGYHVRIATHEKFVPMVTQWNLTFARLDDNPSDLFARPGGEDALRFDLRHPVRNLRATLEYWRDARPVFERLLVSAWRAAQGSDALVFGLSTLWGAHIADALGIPRIRAFLQPFTPTRDFPSPLLPFNFSLGARYNRLTYHIVAQSMQLAWRGAIQRWRRETLRVKSTKRFGDALTMYGFSSHVVPRPSDWSSEQITGYWFLPTSMDWTPSPELAKFLDAGEPPVYIGFGSINVREPRQVLAIIVGALEQTGLRAILSVSHNFTDARLPATMFPIGDVPHAWLFPEMSALVHHGGAGTTGAGLRAGKPTIIIPLAVDQLFWGNRAARLGVGASIPPRALTIDSLSRALLVARKSEMQARAKKLGEGISREEGVARAVELIRARI